MLIIVEVDTFVDRVEKGGLTVHIIESLVYNAPHDAALAHLGVAEQDHLEAVVEVVRGPSS